MPAPMVDKTTLLKQHDFFRDMPAAAIAQLAAHSRVLTFREGERIFARGDAGHGLLAVMSGRVRISLPSEGSTELTLRVIGGGEVLGEISLLDGEPRTADAVAMERSQLLFLERRDFLATLTAEPAAALVLLKVVSGRLRQTSDQLEQVSFGSMRSRLARAILSMSDTSRPPMPTTIALSQRQIGNLIGLSRETTNRYLRSWQQAGFIGLERGRIRVIDQRALARLAEE